MSSSSETARPKTIEKPRKGHSAGDRPIAVEKPCGDAERLAKNLSKGAFEEGLENLARKDDAGKPVMSADTRTQAEKFEAAARELGCDPDEDRFKDVLRKLAKPKT